MSRRSAHLSEWTLEQLVEGTLPSTERAVADAHLVECGRCGAELEAYQSLFAMLDGLPRYAPAVDFGDRVMARVHIAPQEKAVIAWLRRLVPSTRRGWAAVGAVVTAPAMPIIALVAWIIAHPLVSPTVLGQWGAMRTQSIAQTAAAWLLDGTLGWAGWLGGAYSAVQTVPVAALGGGLAFLAVAIPLSAWALVRLVRTPMGSVSYAK